MASFQLRLEKTYWSKGFFNVGVDHQRFVTMREGPLDIFLGDSPQPIVGGRVSRSANRNGTPRIYGNKALQVFFQQHWRIADTVEVEFLSSTAVRVGRRTDR
jgi:hypothetical protein